MAAKLLHSLTDDNPDLQKQIGCMTGIFQLFDRQQIVTGRRITGHSPRRLPPGDSHYNSSTLETDSNKRYHRPIVTEKHSSKSIPEKQRLSTETSRPSFSSSSRSSSFSSLDCNRPAQPEPLSFDRMIFSEIPSRDPAMSHSSASPQFERQSLDLRDLVKDSMYRELRDLSVKTTTKEVAADCLVKRRDSPRPLQLAKNSDGVYSMGPDGKQNLPVDLEESLNVLAKLRDAPWYYDEPSKLSRSSSYQLRDGSFYSVTKDAPRYSYDEREINQTSFESYDSVKQTLKLKELPRLSLDSRESSMRSLDSDLRSSFISRNMQKDGGHSNDQVPSFHQTLKSQPQPPSVVAKLMGLESLPYSASNIESKMSSIKSSPVKEPDPFSRSSKAIDKYIPIQTTNSSRTSWKEPTSPRWKNSDSVMKPMSRLPIEPAPWRLLDGTRGSQKPASRHLKAPAKAPTPFPSVYSEIENRLKDLEFRQSGKDLRALKQILEAMQVKGLLETSKGGQDSNFSNQQDHKLNLYTSPIQNAREVDQRKPQSDQIISYTPRGSNSTRTFQSPIVIMKPAKPVEKSGSRDSSVIPLDGTSSVRRLQGGDFPDKRMGSANSRAAKDQIPKSNRRDHVVSSTDMKTNVRITKPTQTSTRHQQLSKENSASFVKSSGSTSPRLQQKKLELEKRSRPPTPPSDSTKSRKQLNRQQVESSSPGGRRRLKSSNLQQSDHISEISCEMRNLNYKENENSQQSDENIVFDSKMDVEVTSAVRPGELDGNHGPSMQASKYSPSLVPKKSILMLNEDESPAELATLSPEYPSPVSVLDGAVYIDDAPSPFKQMLETINDNSEWNSNGNSTKEQWDPVDSHISCTKASGLTSEVNRKKLQNIEHLVQKLRRLNSSHDEARTDYIASLCENANPDDRYISEILLASGLLLRDLGSNLTTFQFHQSGNPINPELFLVLEQTKSSNLLKEDCRAEKVVQLKSDKEKFHRKLIFDAVNEILVQKLAFVGHSCEPWLWPQKVVRKTLNAQKLLRELCLVIEQLQAKKPACSLEDEDDGLKSILWEDVLHRSESFTDFHGEISGLVLDVERALFKDLVGEIVLGEAANLRVKAGRRRRQLFVK